jgi:hypothetical protein
MAGDKNTGFRLDLGPTLDGKLEDFCEAFFKGTKTEAVRRAVTDYIPRTLETAPEFKALYERLQERRRQNGGVGVTIKELDEQSES